MVVSFRASHRVRYAGAIVGLTLVAFSGSGIVAPAVVGADPPTMTARVLLQGHVRLGSWMAIQVHLHNDGPSVTGELRLQGGVQGGTSYATVVQLDSPSDKDWTLYAQPPSFGQQIEVVLASGGNVIARQKVAVTIHTPDQLVVGVVAENAGAIVGNLALPAVQNQGAAVVVPMAVADLPGRIEAWSALDRLIWQDVDASTLSSEQLAALRGWLALGGRLVILGGTTGIGSLGGFPDEILPYRPNATLDVAPASFTSLLGSVPKGASDVPAMAGELAHGRALATSGDRVVAGQAAYGIGSVTILGADPTVGWLAEAGTRQSLWPILLPPRSQGTVPGGDDSAITSAVGNLPALSLPPLAGLLLLLFGYILLIGPLNYLILRRIDRREWAWVTMPILIAGFAVGSYAFGSALRGSSVIVNEVAIVRGAPDAPEGTARVYLGVFSPARGNYQVAVPGGALLSSPTTGDELGGHLDVLQGNPSRVRNLAVGFGSLRTIRAESQVVAPLIHADLVLVDGKLTGTIRNAGTMTLERPAVVLGRNVRTFQDLAPGEGVQVTVPIATTGFPQNLADQLFGQPFNGIGSPTEAMRRDQTRYTVINQLTANGQQDRGGGGLTSDGPILLAWGERPLLDVSVEGQSAQRVSNVLYFVPMPMTIRGAVTFQNELLTSSIVAADGLFFSGDPTFSFGRGSATVAYRPIPFDGRLSIGHVRLAFGAGGDVATLGGGIAIKPLPAGCSGKPTGGAPADCPAVDQPVPFDSIPDVEVFDRSGAGTWKRLSHPQQQQTYDLADPARYVDAATGTLLLRYVNDSDEQVGFAVTVAIEGTIR